METKLPYNFKIDPLDRWMAETDSALHKYHGSCSGAFVDIGSHVGVVAVRAALRGFAPIFCFEASKPNYDNLVQNMSYIPFPEGRPGEVVHSNLYNLAVTNKTGDDFTLYGFTKDNNRFNTGMRSAFYDQEKHQVESVVKTISFQDILNNHDFIEFLKVDIEGGEYDLFQPSPSLAELLKRVQYISLELHDLVDLTYFRKIDFNTRFPWFDSPETALIEIIQFLIEVGFSDMTYEDVLQTQTIEFSSHNHKFEASEVKRREK